MKEAAEFEACAERLKALADPDRLQIVQCLFDAPLPVSELAAKLGKDIANVSHHLAILRRSRIVLARREGRFIWYSIHPDVTFSASRARAARQIDLGCCRVDLNETGSA